MSCMAYVNSAATCASMADRLAHLEEKYCKKSYSFFLTSRADTFDGVEYLCSAAGGDLVDSKTYLDKYYHSEIVKLASRAPYTYIGLTDNLSEGKWHFNDGTPYHKGEGPY